MFPRWISELSKLWMSSEAHSDLSSKLLLCWAKVYSSANWALLALEQINWQIEQSAQKYKHQPIEFFGRRHISFARTTVFYGHFTPFIFSLFTNGTRRWQNHFHTLPAPRHSGQVCVFLVRPDPLHEGHSTYRVVCPDPWQDEHAPLCDTCPLPEHAEQFAT